MIYRVCAVIVTYNRKELLARNLDSLIKQTYPLDILVYDNASTDGTKVFLEERGYLDKENVIFIQGDKNRGGAGGFCNGEKEAVKRGYDFLWLMDDDGYCINEYTLEECIKHYNPNKKRIINSYILCNPETKELTFNLGPYKTDDDVRKMADNDVFYGFGNPYNGTLVPRQCFEEIGYTDDRFFIYGDENDFCFRSQNAGYEWITPLDSLYYHPINRQIEQKTFIGFKYYVMEQPIWKFYIENRNSFYLKMKYCSGNKSIRIIKNMVRIILSALSSKDKKLKRIKWGLLGLSDGIKDNFDRPIPFKE